MAGEWIKIERSTSEDGVMDYSDFVGRKLGIVRREGIAADVSGYSLFPHQSDLTAWALRRGAAAIFADTEVQRMLTGRPDSYMYSDFVIGRVLNTVFVVNNEAPAMRTVYPYDGTTFSQNDAFAPELTNDGTSTGMEVQRMLFTGFGGIYEYYQDPASYITEAGMTGKMGDVAVTNNGIEIVAERVKMIMRAPLDRLQQMVATSWIFVGDWPCRTDAASPGTAARYKRMIVARHGTPV
jgi:hypothetical protein